MGNAQEKNLSDRDVNRIIEMAWEDRTPFEAIHAQFATSEDDVIKIMRQNLKESSFRMWRKRVSGRKTKHQKLSKNGSRFKSKMQRTISQNKISKR